MTENEEEITRVMQLRQLLLAAIVKPARVIDDRKLEIDREDDWIAQKAIERGLAYEDEPAEFRRLVMIDERGAQAGDTANLLHRVVVAFAKEHGLAPEQMIEVLAVALGRYTGAAALVALGRG